MCKKVLCPNHCLQKHLKLNKKTPISCSYMIKITLTNFHILILQIHVENTALEFYFLWGYRGNMYSLTYMVILNKGKIVDATKSWLKISRDASLCAMISKVFKVCGDEREMQGAGLLEEQSRRMIVELFMCLCWNRVPGACIVPNAWGISWN